MDLLINSKKLIDYINTLPKITFKEFESNNKQLPESDVKFGYPIYYWLKDKAKYGARVIYTDSFSDFTKEFSSLKFDTSIQIFNRLLQTFNFMKNGVCAPCDGFNYVRDDNHIYYYHYGDNLVHSEVILFKLDSDGNIVENIRNFRLITDDNYLIDSRVVRESQLNSMNSNKRHIELDINKLISEVHDYLPNGEIGKESGLFKVEHEKVLSKIRKEIGDIQQSYIDMKINVDRYNELMSELTHRASKYIIRYIASIAKIKVVCITNND